AAIDGMREAIDKRIRAVVPGDKGAIASALITGKRDAISAPVNDAMYISGIGHVLSISGYHMVVVTGVVFFTLRALFALMPAFSNRYPIKKWAALAALGAAAFYLLLSGAEVATQRSFIMIAIALLGGREIVGMVLISLLAGFATTLYTAYHFHRLTPYGVIANFLAMPVVSIWVMPMGMAGVLAMPFGFDGFCWRMMGEGIEWMIAVALWV